MRELPQLEQDLEKLEHFGLQLGELRQRRASGHYRSSDKETEAVYKQLIVETKTAIINLFKGKK